MTIPNSGKPVFHEISAGFGLALMSNPEAYRRFSLLSEEEKRALADGAQNMASKEEIRDYVARALLYDMCEDYPEKFKNPTV